MCQCIARLQAKSIKNGSVRVRVKKGEKKRKGVKSRV